MSAWFSSDDDTSSCLVSADAIHSAATSTMQLAVAPLAAGLPPRRGPPAGQRPQHEMVEIY